MNLRRWLPYSLIGSLAIGGQFLAGIEHLSPTGPLEYLAIVAVAIGIEAMAVWLSVLARERARLGENAWLHWALAGVFAGIAALINIIGHHDLYMSVVFGGFSLAGIVIWVSEQIAMVRHAWDPDGSIRAKVPAYAHLRQFESNDAIIRRARLIAQIHAEQNRDQAQGLGPVTALEIARQQLGEEDRRTRIQRVVRSMYSKRGFPTDQVELALLAYDTEEVARRLVDGADNGALAATLSAGIQPEQLTIPNHGNTNRLNANSRRPAPREPVPPNDPARQPDPMSETADTGPGTSHREPVQGDVLGPPQEYPDWFEDVARAWAESRRQGVSPRNHELAQAGGVSLATLKRNKRRIEILTITITATERDAM